MEILSFFHAIPVLSGKVAADGKNETFCHLPEKKKQNVEGITWRNYLSSKKTVLPCVLKLSPVLPHS
jgi:hypothetical protein